MLSESKAACLLLSLNLILDNKTCLTVIWFRLLEDYDKKMAEAEGRAEITLSLPQDVLNELDEIESKLSTNE